MYKSFQIKSNYDQLKLDGIIISCENPKGIVQISHGMCEHKERYINFMNFLSNHGYLCIIHDHRGHGKSIKDKNDLGYFYDNGHLAIVEDLHQITLMIKQQYPHLPLYLLGHSMGSLVVRCFCQKYDQDIDGFIDESEKTMLAITRDRNAGEFVDVKKVIREVTDRLNKLQSIDGNISGIRTNFRDLDKITSGLQKGDLIILAARPAMGKTAFALNIAHNVAFKSEDPVAIFSLEMPASQLVQRIICSMGGIEGSTMRTGEILKTNANKYYAAAERVSKCNLYIDDTPGVKINEIVAKCRKLKQEHGLKLIVIDYLQLITGSSNNRESRQQEVSDISRQLKMLARELDVPVIALSQLSRSVEQRPNKRPMMSDLRESGAIEQDADIVTFIYREGYYKASEGKEEEDNGLTEIIIAKHRNGATGEVNLAFEKNFSRFTDLAPIGPDGSSAGVRDVRG